MMTETLAHASQKTWILSLCQPNQRVSSNRTTRVRIDSKRLFTWADTVFEITLSVSYEVLQSSFPYNINECLARFN